MYKKNKMRHDTQILKKSVHHTKRKEKRDEQ